MNLNEFTEIAKKAINESSLAQDQSEFEAECEKLRAEYPESTFNAMLLNYLLCNYFIAMREKRDMQIVDSEQLTHLLECARVCFAEMDRLDPSHAPFTDLCYYASPWAYSCLTPEDFVVIFCSFDLEEDARYFSEAQYPKVLELLRLYESHGLKYEEHLSSICCDDGDTEADIRKLLGEAA